jgi:hypothetical protein
MLLLLLMCRTLAGLETWEISVATCVAAAHGLDMQQPLALIGKQQLELLKSNGPHLT